MNIKQQTRHILITSLASLCFFISNAQTNGANQWAGRYYRTPNINGSVVLQVFNETGFKPRSTNDIREFKTIILELSDQAYTQLNIDGCADCEYKHDQYFQIYNMYYKNVTQAYYDENCKALIALMLIDKTIVDR